MRRRILIFSSLFLVFACAAFNYKFYGVDTQDVSVGVLEEIRLVAGRRGDRNKTLADFKTEKGDDLPKGVLVPIDDFRAMREEIVNCRTGDKN